MAKKRSTNGRARTHANGSGAANGHGAHGAADGSGVGNGGSNGAASGGPDQPVYTGRSLVLFREGAESAAMAAMVKAAGLRVASAADFKDEPIALESIDADAVYLPSLGVAIVSGESERVSALTSAAADDGTVLYSEPEQVLFALDAMPGLMSLDYLQGYKDAVDQVYTKFAAGQAGRADAGFAPAPALADPVGVQAAVTWGLQATRANVSRFSGKGIRVAVLDTGIDLRHPDFAGRPIVSQSFVGTPTAQDGNGHGTHCTGTACGPLVPPVSPRYGCAYKSSIYIGKVLSDLGSGTDASILAGIDWALRNRCVIVSMSLGAPVAAGAPPSPVYEAVGTRALAAGTLIVAAAGNDSDRAIGRILPVSRPANSKSILAVGAVDSGLRIAAFSNRGSNPGGGEVNLVGPGVGVHSTWLMPQRYRTISGTSMATPHVAGIAAMMAEAFPTTRGLALWRRLEATARALPGIAPIDRGAGLVQAP